jgi:PAS domain S-box-containing protein
MQTLELEQGETSRSALDFQARVLEAATFSVAVIDSEGKIVLANRAAAEVCGAEVEEVIGRSIYNCIAQNDVVRVAELIHSV